MTVASKLSSPGLKSTLLAGLSALVFASLGSAAYFEFAPDGTVCRPLRASTETSLANLVRVREGLLDTDSVNLRGSALVAGSCLRRVTFSLPSAGRDVSYFLTPDEHYVTQTLVEVQSEVPQAMHPAGQQPGAAQRDVFSREDLAGAASLGPPDAPNAIVEFGDFECPFCSQLAHTLRYDVLPRYGSKVRFVFVHYPSRSHPWASQAAELSECVRRQSPDNFWAVSDYLFQHQSELSAPVTVANLGPLRSTLNLNWPAALACMARHETDPLIERDEALGKAHRVFATPTLFVNGFRIVGPGGAALIESHLADSGLLQPSDKK